MGKLSKKTVKRIALAEHAPAVNRLT